MAIITFFTSKAITLPINAAQNILTNNNLLKNDRFFFSLDYQGRAESDLKNGFWNSEVLMEYKSSNLTVRPKRYSYYGPFDATHSYMVNHRYISFDQEHLCTTWHKVEKRFIEILLIKYDQNEVKRFIPENLPVWI